MHAFSERPILRKQVTPWVRCGFLFKILDFLQVNLEKVEFLNKIFLEVNLKRVEFLS